MEKNFCDFLINISGKQKTTAECYANPLFSRRDGKSLLSFLKSENNSFDASMLTDFANDTGKYTLVPDPRKWIHVVLPGQEPRHGSQQ